MANNTPVLAAQFKRTSVYEGPTGLQPKTQVKLAQMGGTSNPSAQSQLSSYAPTAEARKLAETVYGITLLPTDEVSFKVFQNGGQDNLTVSVWRDKAKVTGTRNRVLCNLDDDGEGLIGEAPSGAIYAFDVLNGELWLTVTSA